MIDGLGGRPGAGPVVTNAVPSAPAGREADPVSAVPRAAREARPTLSGIVKALAAAPPVDAARVERLKAAIANGSYVVDPAAIAAKMIALETPCAG